MKLARWLVALALLGMLFPMSNPQNYLINHPGFRMSPALPGQIGACPPYPPGGVFESDWWSTFPYSPEDAVIAL